MKNITKIITVTVLYILKYFKPVDQLPVLSGGEL